jgi:hypothetical protein
LTGARAKFCRACGLIFAAAFRWLPSAGECGAIR